MKRHRFIKGYLTRFSDFILGFLAALLIITLGRHAMAESFPYRDDGVNTTIKEEYIKIDLEQRRAAFQLPNPRSIEKIISEREALINRPVQENDSLIHHSDDISPVEQSLEFNRPRAAIEKKFDPLNDIEQEIADEQAYELYLERYRGALKQELIRRAKDHGINPTDSLAEEATSKAISRGVIVVPEPIRQPANGIPQN